MTYSKHQFGVELQQQIEKGVDITRIARWAHHNVCLRHALEMDPELKDIVMQIIAMEEGPEFEFSEEELRKTVEDLMQS